MAAAIPRKFSHTTQAVPGEVRGERLASRPFFLVGAERSGTTLLRLLLDRSGDLGWRGEFEFAVEALAESGQWPDRGEFVDRLRRDRVFNHWGLRIADDHEPADLVHDFLVQWRNEGGKPLLGATIHRHLDLIPRIWPKARYVHILRDPRDVAASMVAIGWDGNAWRAIDRWIEVEQSWSRLRARLDPQDWIEIRYESLVRATRFELERLCAFLGISFEESMLSPGDDSTYEAPNPRLIEQWRRRMTPRQVRLVESKAGALMQERGYALSGLPSLSPGRLERRWLRLDDRIRFWSHRLRRFGPRLFIESALSRRLGGDGWRESVRRREHAVLESLLR